MDGGESFHSCMIKAMSAATYRELNQLEKADEYLKDSYARLSMDYGERSEFGASIMYSRGELYRK
jgi:uncharacterized protein (UPF0332 family)